MKKLLLIFFSIILSSCTAKYEEISKSASYLQLLNTQYELIKEMYITGIKLPPGYGKDINIYVISPIHPTWKGPEIISRYALPKGTIFEVQGIKRCTNCFDKESKAIVEVPSYYKVAPVPVEIDLIYIQPKYVKKIK